MATAATTADQALTEATASVRGALGAIPSVLVVAGSGLGGFAGSLSGSKEVSYEDLRHFPASTVSGHAGKLVKGLCAGREILVMNGRKHLYEGVEAKVAAGPLMALLAGGVKTVILSNAAGGLNVKFAVGDLMLISDQINFQFCNPLIGSNNEALGPRFPDMSAAYDPELRALARQAAADHGIALREGVYWSNLGPTYETQAEVQMLRQFADAVGMSTAIETIAAVHAGARVLGISLITNSLVQRTDAVTTHEEVMETGRHAGETFTRLVTAIVAKLPR